MRFGVWPERCTHQQSPFVLSMSEGDARFAGIGMHVVRAALVRCSLRDSLLQTRFFKPFHQLVGFDRDLFLRPCLAVVSASKHPVRAVPHSHRHDIPGVFIDNHIAV